MYQHKGTKIDTYSVTRPLLGKSKFCTCEHCHSYALESRPKVRHRSDSVAAEIVAMGLRILTEGGSPYRRFHVRPCFCNQHRDHA